MKLDGISANTSLPNNVITNVSEVNKTEQLKPQEQQHDQHQKASKEVENEKNKVLSKEDAEHVVNGMNEFLQPQYTSLTFNLHDKSGRYYVEVIDKDTEKVIREIPDKKLLEVYAKMTEYMGLFIDEKL